MSGLVKIAARYGFLAGAIGSVLLAGLYYLGRHPFLIPVFMDFRIILLAVFIFFALREIRDYHFRGVLYFWQGFIGCFIVTACYALLVAVALSLFMSFEPAFLKEYVALNIAQLETLSPEIIERIGRDVYRQNLENLPGTRPADLVSLYVAQTFLISLFLSVILSVILRRQPTS